MIRFSLACANDHGFESWFQSGEAFERLLAGGLITCAVCGSGDISKSLMAPTVRPARKAVSAAPVSARPLTEDIAPQERALAALRREVEKNSEYVGMKFAAEARAIHGGDAPERPIYGEARLDEARKLVEDGVPVAPLPFRPTRKSN
ncbi:MAG: DUF1178 family protein [Rhodobacteraceae bacterium]|nr:DUF1178 family protein [Paracoccaceae bacterium]MCP5341968.1 DUF1178 family protein [Paracoccaceae bacterium]